MSLDTVLAPGTRVQELPTGSDVGGGEGLVGKGCDGPFWAAGALCFSDTGHSRRLSWLPDDGISVLHAPSNKAVGSALDADGSVVGCEFETRRVTRLHPDGRVSVLADSVDGDRLAGPDDVVVASDGSVWFTDVRTAFPAVPGAPPSAVYRIARDGTLARVSGAIATPGGLAFAPDEQTMYVSDMGTRELIALDPSSGSTRPFARVEGDAATMPQGLAVDELGNLYCGGPGGIWVFAPDGSHVGVIAHPASSTTNVAFGGDDGRTLFFTTSVAVGYVELLVAGASQPGTRASTPPAGWAARRPIEIARRVERETPAMDAIVAPGTEIEELGSGGVFDDLGGGPHSLYARSLEGTVWDHEGGYLFFSDIGNDRRLRYTPGDGISTLHPHTNHTNGATLDSDRAVISCEHSTRRVSRLARDGGYSVVADRCDGKLLSRPNDVVVRSDGNVYFTNPWWDFGSGDASELDYPTFYRVDPEGRVFQGSSGYVVPNGLALTPDESVLYVNDSYGPPGVGPNIKAYDVAADGSLDLDSERVFFRFHGEGPGNPDGMKVDLEGNVYCGGPGGLWVLSSTGEHLGKIVHGATQVNNLAFGGDDWRTLYFCSWSALFRIQLLVPGVPVPRGRPA
jgi:gluconolactonase